MVAYSVANSADIPVQEVFDVYSIALRQATGHGLALGRDLKQKYPRSKVIVYGKPDGRGAPPRGKVEASWGVDQFIPFVPDASDVGVIVRSLLKGQAAAVSTPPLTSNTRPANASNPTADPRLRTIPPGQPASSPPAHAAPRILAERAAEGKDDDEPTWSELINAPLSLDTLGQMLRKDMFGRGSRTA
jgi:hypothetical protein